MGDLLILAARTSGYSRRLREQGRVRRDFGRGQRGPVGHSRVSGVRIYRFTEGTELIAWRDMGGGFVPLEGDPFAFETPGIPDPASIAGHRKSVLGDRTSRQRGRGDPRSIFARWLVRSTVPSWRNRMAPTNVTCSRRRVGRSKAPTGSSSYRPYSFPWVASAESDSRVDAADYSHWIFSGFAGLVPPNL